MLDADRAGMVDELSGELALCRRPSRVHRERKFRCKFRCSPQSARQNNYLILNDNQGRKTVLPLPGKDIFPACRGNVPRSPTGEDEQP